MDSVDFKSLIVCGDFNLSKVYLPETWGWMNQGGQEEEDFLYRCDHYFMTQVISRSTFGPNEIGGKILEINISYEIKVDIEENP